MRILLIGGSKSGKSTMGQRLTRTFAAGAPMYYWATMEPTDEEDLARIARHLKDREGWGFETEARAEISGFIGLLGDYIAGIFVRREARSGGVGRQLLDHVKTSRGQLRLQVYRKNLRAAAFYRREGFRVLEEGVDPETGEAELLMEWRWDGPQS